MPRTESRGFLAAAALRGAAIVLTLLLVPARAGGDDAVRVFAAGSLKAALAEIGKAYSEGGGGRVEFVFGPSGILKDRLMAGERADIFASANMEHPASLRAAGKAAAVTPFARNRLCALAGPQVEVTSETLVERMLDPGVKLGTSTPKSDPSGDYAWELFEKAEKVRKGAYKGLSGKALQLTGGPNSPPPPKDRSMYAMLVAEGTTDIFLTYCTNALIAQSEVKSLQIIRIPQALEVGANYGMATLQGAGSQAQRFADFVTGPEGQAILLRYGFASAGDR